MSPAVIAGVALPIAATYLLLQPTAHAGLSLAGRIALAIGLGLGIASCEYFVALIAFDGRGGGVFALDALLLLGGCAVWWRSPAVAGAAPSPRWDTRDTVLLLLVIGAGLAAAVSVLANTFDTPHGRWDAWATWNVRARWLFASGAHWREAFVPPAMHADYPLLIPTSVARLWTYGGAVTLAEPALVGFAFAAALASWMYAATAALRGRLPALVATLCLLGTPLFLRIAGWQYADLPLAFNLLATVGLLALYDRDRANGRPFLILAGVAGGLMLWTKNEGTMLLTMTLVVRAGVMAVRRRPDFRFAWFGAGLLPPLLVVLYFKMSLSPPISLYREPLTVLLGRLLDPQRYATVFSIASFEVARGTVPVVVGLIAYALLLGPTRDRGARRQAATVAAILFLAALAYLLTYLTARADPNWLVSYSVDRLALHLWPSALLALFLFAATPAEHALITEPAAAPRRPKARRPSARRR